MQSKLLVIETWNLDAVSLLECMGVGTKKGISEKSTAEWVRVVNSIYIKQGEGPSSFFLQKSVVYNVL